MNKVLWRSKRIGRHRVRRRIKKLIGICGAGGGSIRKRKVVLVKDDMPRNDDHVGRQVKTAISFMMSRITKEDTQSGSCREFVRSSG
jgi:hypothetical protein